MLARIVWVGFDEKRIFTRLLLSSNRKKADLKKPSPNSPQPERRSYLERRRLSPMDRLRMRTDYDRRKSR